MRIVAISDCDHAAMQEELQVFSENDCTMMMHQCKTEDDLIQQMQDYSVIGNQYAPMTDRVFDNLPNLKCVVRYGVGVNHIDLQSAARHGVAICNVPDYGVREVALQAFTMMLALHRKLIPMNESVKDGKWNYELSIPIARLADLTVGVVGIGRIGTMFASMLVPMGCKILACDPAFTAETAPSYVELVDMDTLIEKSDIISIHSNLETSYNLFTYEEMKRMKPDVLLINVSRGGIINEQDLVRALEEKIVGGAAMDVFCAEPAQKDHPLFKFPNFICTPHMAWYSEEASRDLKRKLAEEMVRAVNGEPLRYKLV